MRLGQHFLRHQEDALRIIAVLAPEPQQRIVEIGSGQGALTRPLLDRLQRLDAIEKDWQLAMALQLPGLHIHRADAVRFDYRSLARRRGGPLRLVGNLPYAITAPLLFRLLSMADIVTDMLFMVQREVAARAAAIPGHHGYGRLSVMLQRCCVVQPVFELPPAAFVPPPRVYSTLLRLVPHSCPVADRVDPTLYAELVRRAFTARRKTLRNALRGTVDAAHIAAAGLDGQARPEQLSPADYARLAVVLGGQH